MKSLWDHACSLGARPRHVVHVGAHWAQEAEDYESFPPDGQRIVDWFEALPDVAVEARRRIAEGYANDRLSAEHRVHTALLAERSGVTRPFWVADNNGCSSSMLQFARHAEYAATRMTGSVALTTTTLDDYCLAPDWITLDCQGAEARVLTGAMRTLASVEWIATEVSTVPLYDDQWLLDDIDGLLFGGNDRGAELTRRARRFWHGDRLILNVPDWAFERVETDLSMFDGTHGDALYRRVR